MRRHVPLVLLVLLAAGPVVGSHGGPHPTRLDLAIPSMWVGEQGILFATLRFPWGDPVPGMQVVFELETTFGWLELGRRFTNADGEVSLEYVPTGAGTFAFRVRFEGGPDLDPSEDVETATIGDVARDTPFPTATAIAFVVAVVVGSVWGAYAFVLLELRGIWIQGGGRPRIRGRRGVRAK